MSERTDDAVSERTEGAVSERTEGAVIERTEGAVSERTDDTVGSAGLSRPLLRVVRGTPDEAELAALAAVVASLRPERATAQRARSSWADRRRLLPDPTTPSRGGWRASALPR